MKITCNIIDDLLPLYIDGGCAKESIELIEEHLKECSSCREKLHRMQSDNFESPAEVVDILVDGKLVENSDVLHYYAYLLFYVVADGSHFFAEDLDIALIK